MSEDRSDTLMTSEQNASARRDNGDRPDVILIGPIRAGKSTIARLLAEALGVPQISMDEVCGSYYKEIGFVRGDAGCRGNDGMIDARFNLHTVERTLSDHQNCVIDMGAGHSVYRDEASLARLESVLAPYPNLFLLLPSPDLDESAAILKKRNVQNPWLSSFQEQHGYDPNEHFLRHASNFRLAKHVIYTKGKSPEVTRDEILARMKHRPQPAGTPFISRQRAEMIEKLTEALAAAKDGSLTSLILITMSGDGGSDCWARINSDVDNAAAKEYLNGLQQDLGMREQGG
jgi:shikimate kinase